MLVRHECGRDGSFYLTHENVLVKPYFGRNVAYWNIGFRDGEEIQISDATSFHWDVTYTPRVCLGYESACGAGLRGRYWNFSGDTRFSRAEGADEELIIETDLFDASDYIGVDGVLHGGHAISAKVFDLEFTQSDELGLGKLVGFGGVRYMDFGQHAHWFETGDTGPDSDESLDLQHHFKGIGPTLGAQGSVPLLGRNLSFFANGRASLLFGNRSGSMIGKYFEDELPNYHSLLTTLEAQAGVEWNVAVMNKDVSLRAAMEAQVWLAGGGASGGDGEGIPADQTNMGFFGASLSTTVSF